MDENTSKMAGLRLSEDVTYGARALQEHHDAQDFSLYRGKLMQGSIVGRGRNEIKESLPGLSESSSKPSSRTQEHAEVFSGFTRSSRKPSGTAQEHISHRRTNDIDSREQSEDSDFEDELIASLQRQINRDIDAKQFEKAERLLTKLVSLSVDSKIEWQWKLCACLEEQEKWEKVAKLLEGLNPSEPRVCHHLSLAYLELKDYSSAASYCKEALKGRKRAGKNDAYYTSMALMANILAAKGETVESEAYQAIVKKRQPQLSGMHSPSHIRKASRDLWSEADSNNTSQIRHEGIEQQRLEIEHDQHMKLQKKLALQKPEEDQQSQAPREKVMFWDAVSRDDLNGMQREISRGVNIRVESEQENNIFWAALKKSPLDIVKLTATPANFHLRKLARAFHKADVGERLLSPLLFAIENGREDVFNLLLEQGYDYQEIDNHGYSTSYSTARCGQALMLSALIAQGYNVNSQEGTWRDTVLAVSSEKGHEAVVKLLLDKGASVNQPNSCGITALWQASRKGHEAVVRLLLDRGAWIDKPSNDGITALREASREGHEAVVKLLLNRGARMDIPGGNSSSTALWIASWNGHEAVVKLLLDKGASVEQPNNSGVTALWEASRAGHEAIVKLLLDKGAFVDQLDKHGIAALGMASERRHEAVVRLLLDKGASVDHPNNLGITALWIASREGHEAIVKLLLDKGASVDHPDNIGITALWIASRESHEVVVRLLLDRGAWIDKPSNDGTTALREASRQGHEVVVKLLLDRGARIDMLGGNSRSTALWIASWNGHEAVVKLLLDKGASVEQPNNSGVTALWEASRAGHEAIVKLLLAKGASIDKPRNSSGVTALWIASQEGHEAVVKLLLDKGASVGMPRNDGTTALLIASQEGHEAVVKLLRSYGAR